MARHPKRNVVFQPPSTAGSILLEGMAILIYIRIYICIYKLNKRVYIYIYICICILLKPMSNHVTMSIPWVSHEIHVVSLLTLFWGQPHPGDKLLSNRPLPPLVISYSKLEDMPFQFKDVRWNTWWFTLIYWFRWFALLYWFRWFTLIYWFRWFTLIYWFDDLHWFTD